MAKTMRVLLIGASGQLGTALAAAFGSGTELVETAWRHPQPHQRVLDLGDAGAVRAELDRVRADVVLLAGAMCHVDGCEEQPDLCRRINVQAPAIAAEAARRHGSWLVFFSTDHVFDGEGPGAYGEDDPVNPLSVYARSKVDAEQAIRDALPERHLIVRTGWVYGPDSQRRNFILRLIERLRAGESVTVPSDQAGSPTFTEDLARAVRHLVSSGAAGTFHATGPELVDRVSLAHRVCDRFALNPALIVPVPTRALGQAARRSLRVELDCAKLGNAGAPPFRGIHDGLDALAAWAESGRSWQHA